MADVLSVLRDAIASGVSMELLHDNSITDDIAIASHLAIHKKPQGEPLLDTKDIYNLDEQTNYTIDTKALPLRAIYNAWLHRDSSVADYISASQLKKIETINFKNKNDLISYLTSRTSTLANLNGSSDSNGAAASVAATDVSKVSDRIRADVTVGSQDITSSAGAFHSSSQLAQLSGPLNPVEAPLLHNPLFQGEKLINFEYLVKDAQIKIINHLKSEIKRSATHARGGVTKPTATSLQRSKNRNGSNPNERPIILLSPSTSALLQMSNVKEFLETGIFNEPAAQSLNNNASNLLIVKKDLPNLGPQKFLIVNSTEFFTKPEYWNRVVAIFTTGQSWQFKNYPIKDPERLFQKYKGFSLSYDGDIVNKNVASWNVEVIKIDRNRRFNDKEISAYFWASLERSMILRGHKR